MMKVIPETSHAWYLRFI